MQKKCYNNFIVALILFVILGSLTSAASASQCCNPKDPYENFNRSMYRFNDWLDRYILKPTATVYNTVVPKPLAKGLSNFFSNIDMVPTICNDLLQGNFYRATSDTWRFGINTTAGILGFFDVAACIGLEPNYQDLGLTWAHWGYRNSNYLVLPFYGPSTFRDAMAMPFNYTYLSLYPYIQPTKDQLMLYGVGVVVRRADLLCYEDFMQQAAVDKYTFIRDAYMQHRNYLIERNKHYCPPDRCKTGNNT